MTLVLIAIAVTLSWVALVFEHLGNVRISERHHSHHDTYVVPVAFTRSLVFAMAFMGCFGVLMSWLCHVGAFATNSQVIMGFCDAFIVTCFVLWWAVSRYRVASFEDRMVIRPFAGRSVTVRYEDIDHLEWVGMRKGSGYRDLVVVVGGQRVARISAVVDIEQVLMRIDRFDVLPQAL